MSGTKIRDHNFLNSAQKLAMNTQLNEVNRPGLALAVQKLSQTLFA